MITVVTCVIIWVGLPVMKHRCWDHGKPAFPGLSPVREVPHGHLVRSCRWR